MNILLSSIVRRSMKRNLIALVTTSILLGVIAQTAYAATWSIQSVVYCVETPNGGSWLSWSGQGGSAWGNTYAGLWRWTGTQWVLQVEGNASDSGDYGDAHVYNEYAGGTYNHGYNWEQTGTHWASFFSGYKYSDSGSRYCP